MKNNLSRQLLSVAIGAVIGSSLILANPAQAQSSDGAVTGVVTEQGRVTVANAQLTIRNKDTGFARSITADQQGRFRFSRMPIGRYQITARKDGYESVVMENVRVTIGNVTDVELALVEGALEQVVVVADPGSYRLDTSSSESGMTIYASEFEILPVGRSLDEVALLTPGAIRGTEFGGVSYGGSSAGENAVFINGLNVSDVETGIAHASAPFSFYEQFQVKTGGYSVEYGRATGGVVSAVVKRGGNEFKYGAQTYYTPDSLRGSARNGYNRDGERVAYYSRDESDSWSTSVYASGPIIEDRLFFYALYQPRNNELTGYSADGDTRTESGDDSAFWGGRVDWQIAENHTLELVAFSDKRDSVTDRYVDNDYLETQFVDRGGENYIATYTGHLSDNLTMRFLYGHSETSYDFSSTTGAECNRVYYGLDEPVVIGGQPMSDEHIGCTTASYFDARYNSRDALRLDVEYLLGDHLLRFGMDNEVRTTEMNRTTTGPSGTRYSISEVTPGEPINGEVVSGDAYVLAITRNTNGVFDQDTTALYLEDIWSLNDSMTLTMGLRYDEFDSKDAAGNSFLKIEDMISPRFGFAWDINNDGASKLFANAGRYYYPLPNGMPAREGGGTQDLWNYYQLAGLETNTTSAGLINVTPILGEKLGETVQFGAATAGRDDVAEVVDNDLEASYQDEFILGYERLLNDEWKFGIRGIYREFHNAIEDMRIDVNTENCGNISGWVFGNPGRELTLTRDCGSGPETVTIDLGQTQDFDIHGNPIGGPEVERDYKALELVLDRAMADNWSMNVSYTLSRSEGNYEGSVNSDTGNDIPGWTEAGDNVAYLISNYGRTPNDRTHSFKLRSTYAATDSLLLSAIYTLTSGRPLNVRSYNSGQPFTDSTRYGFNYICVECVDSTGEPLPIEQRVYRRIDKGEYGDTDWVGSLDLGAYYTMEFNPASLQLGLRITNLFNSQSATQQYETIRTSFTEESDNFLAPYAFQSPRAIQLIARVDF